VVKGVCCCTYDKNDHSTNIHFSGLSYVGEVVVDHRCRFRCCSSNTDQIFCIRHILEKKRDYNGIVHNLFVEFEKASDSVRREALYNILTEFGVTVILVRLIKCV
jgi:hypothetical protein